MDDLGFGALLELAIAEDLGAAGDVSSTAIFSGERARAVIICRDRACLAGLAQARQVFARIDPALECRAAKEDGDALNPSDTVLELSGPTASLLQAERIALNIMAYLSGIATQTRDLVAQAAALGDTVILDTRKTLPGYRRLAKHAVRLGGGRNHRMGLYDMVMIKDNHIDAAGGIPAAVGKVRARWGNQFRIELECRTLDEVRQGLDLGVDIIMLDNMDENQAAAALRLRNGEYPGSACAFEASGDMNPAKLERFGGLGLDFISVGRLTHSVTAVNFSLQIRA